MLFSQLYKFKFWPDDGDDHQTDIAVVRKITSAS